MARPLHYCIRQRIISLNQKGHGVCDIARLLDVSISPVSKLLAQWRKTGSIAPKPQGNGGGHGKIAPHEEWFLNLVRENKDLTLQEYADCLLEEKGVKIDPSNISRFLSDRNLSRKKLTKYAEEQLRPDVQEERKVFETTVIPKLSQVLDSLVCVDETSVSFNMARQYGWSLKGERCVGYVPNSRRRSQTLIAGLRLDGVISDFLFDGYLERLIFEAWVELFLCPQLRLGDIVLFDNLSAHKSPLALEMIRDHGAEPVFLPRYSPNFNPIEMWFSKLKALLRKLGERTFDGLERAIEGIGRLIHPDECRNYFAACGYVSN